MRITGFLKTTAVFLFSVLALTSKPAFPQIQVGKASYVTSGNFSVPNFNPYITSDFSQKVISDKWWATLMTQQFSSGMWAHPLDYQTTSSGLQMGYPGAPTVQGDGIYCSYVNDLTVGIDGLNAQATAVASYSHFGVTARWTSGAMLMEATLCQGIPFAYFKITGGNAKIAFNDNPTIWYNQGGVVGATVDGHNYGIFAPTGASWSGKAIMTSSLAGKNYLSVALLPDNTAPTLSFFQQYAYSFVTDTRVSWTYDEQTAILTDLFSVATQAKEGSQTGTIFAVFRHQWKEMPGPFLGYTYQSARGVMKVVAGQSFTVPMKFNGILTTMPDSGVNKNTLNGLVQGENIPNSIGSGSCTYNKELGRFAQLCEEANLAGNTAKRDAIVAGLESGLQNWFTADGQPEFYYHKPWNRLIGYPTCFYADTRFADHHFHYGYYLHAASVVAEYDSTWAKLQNWGGMVQMLIRDVNSWDDNDSLFGRFAYFEPYEGHGWADGMGFSNGSNQESSSESMNFNAGLVLWGVMTGNKTLRDEGIFMYVNEARAIEQYWWDVDHVTFPSGYSHTCVGQVWSNGGAYGTWFSGDVSAINGINILPNTAGHMYYGRCPDYIPLNYKEGFNGGWSDLFYEFLAYSDAATAMSKYNGGTGIEAGNTQAACYNEIASLNAVGRLDTTITGSVPTFGVFDKGNTRTYCAYNALMSSQTVTFNDGFSMVVPARKQICASGPVRPVSVRSSLSRPEQTGFTGMMRLLVAGNGFHVPRLDVQTRTARLYDVKGKEVWASDVIAGTPQASSVQLAKGLYLLKQFR